MYASNQINGLSGYLGEVRQDANGNLYQLGEVVDERGNVGVGWHPYSQPQIGEVRRGADGQLYQYSVDGLGNVGFAPLIALASKALPAIANAIPGVSNIVQGLLPGILPGAPSPTAPVSATVSVPAPAPMPYPPAYPRPGLFRFLNNLVPRIADSTAQLVMEKIQPLIRTSSRTGRRRRGFAGVDDDPSLYGLGEREFESLGDYDLGAPYDELGDGEPYLSDDMGYSDYEPVNGIDGYVKGPISSGPAFTSREPASELWKPLW